MRILVVDDHEIVRRGICSVLASEPTFNICGEAVDGQDAVEKARDLTPDIVVMDISMPRMNGLDATREIKQILPQVEIVVVSQYEVPEMARQAFQAGARAYVVKSTIATDLLAAIEKVNERESFVKGVDREGATLKPGAEAILQGNAKIDKAIRDSEKHFRSVMNNLAEGLYTLDAAGVVTYINPSAEKMFGWTSAELFGKKIHNVIHYKHPDGTQFPEEDCPSLQVLHNGVEHRDHEDTFIRKDGSFFPVMLSSSRLKLNEAVVGMVVSFRDVTRRRQAEEAARQSERIYRAIGESIDYGIWISDATGRNIYSSSSFLNLIGLTQQQCSEFGWMHIIHPEDVAATEASRQECISKGIFWEREHRFRGEDGHYHAIHSRDVPIRDPQGKIIYWAGINLDIQRRTESDQATSLLASIVDSSDDAIISKSLDSVITSWNNGASRIFGYSAEEAIGQNIRLIIPPDRWDEEEKIIERLRRGERIDHFETVRLRKDRTLIDISLTISPVRDPKGRIVGASKVARDVTERQRAEQALRESEERFRAIVETTPECVKLVAPDGTLLQMNSSGLAMVGADCAEVVVGKSVYDLIAPHDRDKFRAFNERICRARERFVRVRYCRIAGHGSANGNPRCAVPAFRR